jgi:hypothetical protein
MTNNDPADPNTDTPPNDSEPLPKREGRTRRDLIIWLASLPVILGLLVLCGQAALLFALKQSDANTQSLLQSNYAAWVYDLIPPINIPELIEDIREDLRAEGIIETPIPVITTVYWVPPTPTALSVANATATATFAPPTATRVPPQPTATEIPPEPDTPVPSATSTATATLAPLLPTSTNTQPPPPPTATATNPPPTATSTPRPTATVYVPPPTAIPYRPVSPVAENGGNSTPDGKGGCTGSFGYVNQNASAVSIPIGPRNQLNIEGGSPTSFARGQITGAFTINWKGGGPVIWDLDGSRAVLNWCNP